MSFEDDLSHTITVVAYHDPPDSAFIWRVAVNVVRQERFSVLQDKLSTHLEAAIQLVKAWTPEAIMEKGERPENLRKKYGA